MIYMTEFSGYNEYKLQYIIQYRCSYTSHILLIINMSDSSAMVMVHFNLFRRLSSI